MAVVDGQLYFAPGILMKDLDFNDHALVLKAFQRRVHGLFIEPIVALEQREDIHEGALFGAALLVAALIESIARVEHAIDANGSLIKTWLETHVEEFNAECSISGGREAGAQSRSLADVFEYRFRNGLAHNGYVASLGRLSGALKRPVTASGSVVTVNPFLLARVVEEQFESFAADLLAVAAISGHLSIGSRSCFVKKWRRLVPKRLPNIRLQPSAAGAIMGRRG